MGKFSQTIPSGGKTAGAPARALIRLLQTGHRQVRAASNRQAMAAAYLLLALFLLGCGYFSFIEDDRPDETGADASSSDATPIRLDTPTLIPTPTAEVIPSSTSAVEVLPSPTPKVEVIPVSTPTSKINSTGDSVPTLSQKSDSIIVEPARPEPKIKEITFAWGATEDYVPINPGLLFTHGITEVHAIFEYSGILPGDTWERVWYLNEKEVARVSKTWTGPEAGVFDYFIDNSGRPLPAGDWILELYVEGELKTLGAFIVDSPQEETAAQNSGPYPLAYTRCDGDRHNIYVADTNGHNEQLIVTRGAGPSWSPSGGTIFFFGESGVDRQNRGGIEYVFDGVSDGLVAMRASPLPTSIDQLNLFQYTDWKQGTARWASVSPDGSMVAFDARPGGDYRIYFLGTAENQQYRFEILGEQADWSPDSQKIAYRSGRDGRTGIWISNRDDTSHTLITNDGSDSFPAWSPDGSTIAFSRAVDGNVDIHIVNIDGSNLRRLTNTPGHDTLPTYAPNGDIIFRSARTGSWGIWKMSGDGSDQTEIIPNACVGNDWAYSKMDVLFQ
jgi:hypothetical protein